MKLRPILVFAILFLFLSDASAKTLTVSKTGGGQFRRIQDAIDVSAPGDAISVAAGIYSERIDLKDGITLQGEGRDLCRIEYDGSNTVLTAFNITNGAVDGFTFIYSGVSEKNAIWVISSNLKISNSAIQGAVYAGIEAGGDSNISIENNIITANKKSGIFIHSNSKAKILKNEITNNGLSGMEIKKSEGIIEDNLISLNKTSGIFINDNSKGRIFKNRVVNNGFNGINVKDNSLSEIINNVILGNASVGILAYNGSAPIVKNNIIIKNQKGISAGNVQGQISDGKPIVSFNDVWRNSILDYEILSKAATDIASDPMFVDEAKGDYHLKVGSPAIDAGEGGEDMGAYPKKQQAITLPWDINADGIVDILDLVFVASRLNSNAKEADVNADGSVDIFDIVAVASHFGERTSPASPRRVAKIDYSPYLSLLEKIYELLALIDSPSLEFKTAKDLLAVLIEATEGGEGNFANSSASSDTAITRLFANYPNPFNPETWIPFQLAEDADVVIRIYDSLGKLIRSLSLGFKPKGTYMSRGLAAYWDGKNELDEPVASGIYFYEMPTTKGFRSVKKMTMIK